MTERQQRVIKRVLDVTLASAGLCLGAPLYGLIATLVLKDMGRPVLFRQKRPGLNDEPFGMLKFRTMRHPRPGEDAVYSDKDRLTPLGRILKKYSLDELPELLNVVRGEMSLVGPRPLLMEYLDKYTPEQRRRHHVKPGITGWAQINGRTALTMSKKFELDVWYVDHWSIALDLKILALTLVQVIRPEETNVEQDHAKIDDLGFLKPRNENRQEP